MRLRGLLSFCLVIIRLRSAALLLYCLVFTAPHASAQSATNTSGQSAVHGSIGVIFDEAQSASSSGVTVSIVVPNGPAAKAGLMPQDIIVAVNGTPVKNGNELVSIVAAMRPGQTARLIYLRKGQPQSVEVSIVDLDKLYASYSDPAQPTASPSGIPQTPQQVDKKNYAGLVQQGNAQLQSGNAAQALALGQQAIKLDPSQWEGYLVTGAALMNLKQYEAAITQLSDALSRAPSAKQAAIQGLISKCVSAKAAATKPAGPPTSTTVTQAEIVLWKTIENSNNADDYNAYLRQYPQGAYVGLANAKLEQLAWPVIQNSTNPADFTTFLNRYPNGVYAAQAKQRIADINAQQEQAKQERILLVQQLEASSAKARAKIPGELSNSPVSATDPVTGLMWEKPVLKETTTDNQGKPLPPTSLPEVHYGNEYDGNYNQAAARCANLRLLGFSDWRLPTAEEVTNLLKKGPKARILKDIGTLNDSYLVGENGDGPDYIISDHNNPQIIEVFENLWTSTPGKKSEEHIAVSFSYKYATPGIIIDNTVFKTIRESQSDGITIENQCVHSPR